MNIPKINDKNDNEQYNKAKVENYHNYKKLFYVERIEERFMQRKFIFTASQLQGPRFNPDFGYSR